MLCIPFWGTASTSYTLRGSDINHFSTYLSWLYTAKLATKPADGTKLDLETGEDNEYIKLAGLFLLSKQLRDDKFGDTVVDAFVYKLNQSASEQDDVPRLPGPTCINMIYAKFGDCIHFTAMIVDAYASAATRAEVSRIRYFVNADFLADLNMKLLELRGAPDLPVGGSNCDYHSHSSGETCAVEGRSRKRRRIADD